MPQGLGAQSQALMQQGLAWDAQLEFRHKASAFRMLYTMADNQVRTYIRALLCFLWWLWCFVCF